MCLPLLGLLGLGGVGAGAGAGAAAAGAGAAAGAAAGSSLLPTLIGAAASGVGTAVSLLTARAESKAEEQAMHDAANSETIAGSYRAKQVERQAEKLAGSQRAAFVASGLNLSGSATDVLNAGAVEAARDIDAIRFNTDSKVRAYDYKAQAARIRGKNQGLAAGIGFVTPLIKGVARFEPEYS